VSAIGSVEAARFTDSLAEPNVNSHRPRSSGHSPRTATGYTRGSVDSCLQVDLDCLAFSAANVDELLDAAFGFDVKAMREKAVSEVIPKLQQNSAFRSGMKEYLATTDELRRYHPIAKIINTTIGVLQEVCTSEPLECEVVPLGRKTLKGYAGQRQPDIIFVHSKHIRRRKSNNSIDINLIEWIDPTAVGELKVGTKGSLPKELPSADDPVTSLNQPLSPTPSSSHGRKHGSDTARSSNSKRRRIDTADSTKEGQSGSRPSQGSDRPWSLPSTGNSGSNHRKHGYGEGFRPPSDPLTPAFQHSPAAPAPEDDAAAAVPDINSNLLVPYSASSVEVQLANYALQMASSPQHRDIVIVVHIEDVRLTLWVYDSEGAVATEMIDWQKDLTSFALVIYTIARFTTHRKDPRQPDGLSGLESMNDKPSPVEWTIIQEDNCGSVNNNVPPSSTIQGELNIRFKRHLYSQHALFGRKTRVFHVEVWDRRPDESKVQLWADIPLVLKVCWQPATRTHEGEYIKKAREVDPEHTPAVFAYGRVRDSASVTSKMRDRCKPPRTNSYERRELHVLIMRQYSPAHSLHGQDFLQVFRDIVICEYTCHKHS
jgi:hypothetical protein